MSVDLNRVIEQVSKEKGIDKTIVITAVGMSKIRKNVTNAAAQYPSRSDHKAAAQRHAATAVSKAKMESAMRRAQPVVPPQRA